MGIRSRIDAAAGHLSEGFNGARALFADAGEEPVSVERFLILLVRAVRDDDDEVPAARDVYVSARKRRRRLGVLAFGAGPLVGVANQFADLYCETAVVCDLAALHGIELTDEQIGAHMLELWDVVEDLDEGVGAMGGEPPVAAILSEKLRDRAGEQLPEELTMRSVAKALWDVRGAISNTRDGISKGAVRTVVFTGHRTKKVIKRAEAQLGL